MASPLKKRLTRQHRLVAIVVPAYADVDTLLPGGLHGTEGDEGEPSRLPSGLHEQAAHQPSSLISLIGEGLRTAVEEREREGVRHLNPAVRPVFEPRATALPEGG